MLDEFSSNYNAQVFNKKLYALAKYVEELEESLNRFITRDEMESFTQKYLYQSDNFINDSEYGYNDLARNEVLDSIIYRIERLENYIDSTFKTDEIDDLSINSREAERPSIPLIKDEKCSKNASVNDIERYTGLARAAAKVLNVAAQGLDMIVDKVQVATDTDTDTADSGTNVENDEPEERKGISGILNSVEKLLSGNIPSETEE